MLKSREIIFEEVLTMNMEENWREYLDFLKSPLWIYVTQASTVEFTSEDRAAYMIAQKKWEKKHLEAKIRCAKEKRRIIVSRTVKEDCK